MSPLLRQFLQRFVPLLSQLVIRQGQLLFDTPHFLCRFAGSPQRPVLVFSCTPRPGFRHADPRARPQIQHHGRHGQNDPQGDQPMRPHQHGPPRDCPALEATLAP